MKNMILVAGLLAVSIGICAAQGLAPTKLADNVTPTKAELEEMYNTAYRAFDAGKFLEALKHLDAIDARQPDLAASPNNGNLADRIRALQTHASRLAQATDDKTRN